MTKLLEKIRFMSKMAYLNLMKHTSNKAREELKNMPDAGCTWFIGLPRETPKL